MKTGLPFHFILSGWYDVCVWFYCVVAFLREKKLQEIIDEYLSARMEKMASTRRNELPDGRRSLRARAHLRVRSFTQSNQSLQTQSEACPDERQYMRLQERLVSQGQAASKTFWRSGCTTPARLKTQPHKETSRIEDSPCWVSDQHGLDRQAYNSSNECTQNQGPSLFSLTTPHEDFSTTISSEPETPSFFCSPLRDYEEHRQYLRK